MSSKTNPSHSYSAFGGNRSLAQGSLSQVAKAAKAFTEAQSEDGVVVLEDATCRIVDLDLSGDEQLVSRKADHHPRLSQTQADKPSSRAISLLPRHWSWLARQSDNPSAALRRLIDQVRRDPDQQRADRQRDAQQITFRFCQALCGDLAGFEEAMRALYRQDKAAFIAHTQSWPHDLASRARGLAGPNWPA